MPWIGFVFVMGHMSINQLNRQFANAPDKVDITGGFDLWRLWPGAEIQYHRGTDGSGDEGYISNQWNLLVWRLRNYSLQPSAGTCKTVVCHQRISQIFNENELLRNFQVFWTLPDMW